MKDFSGPKWGLVLAGVFAAATDAPVARTESATPAPAAAQKRAAAHQVEAITASLQTVAVLSVAGATPAESCQGPLKVEVKEACLEGKLTMMPVAELAKSTGALLSHGKDGVGLIVGVLQGLYPSSKKRLENKKKAAAAP